MKETIKKLAKAYVKNYIKAGVIITSYKDLQYVCTENEHSFGEKLLVIALTAPIDIMTTPGNTLTVLLNRVVDSKEEK